MRHSTVVHTNNFSEKLHKYMTPQATITIRRNLPLSSQLQMQRVQFPGDYDPRELMSDPQREPHLKLSVYSVAAYLLVYFLAFLMHIMMRIIAKRYRNLEVLMQCGFPVYKWTGAQ